MRKPVEIWCDECGVKIESRHNFVQWSANKYNGHHFKDFCGYPCAEKFRDRAMEQYAQRQDTSDH